MTYTEEQIDEALAGGYSEGVRLVILAAALRDARAAQTWISVKERLPEEGRRVLVFNVHGYADIEKVHDPKSNEPWENYLAHSVTHWMPLPPPPKEEV